MKKVRQFIARISVYDKNGKTVATSWDSWSGNRKPTEFEVTMIKNWIKEGVYDRGDKFGKYAKKHGCVITIFEAKEVSIFEGKV